MPFDSMVPWRLKKSINYYDLHTLEFMIVFENFRENLYKLKCDVVLISLASYFRRRIHNEVLYSSLIINYPNTYVDYVK